MFTEMLDILSHWEALDTWIVVTGALAAMACALPGVYLVLRRQSMMGDALSHTVLPGVVIAFLLAHDLLVRGWLTWETYQSTRHTVMYVGAMAVGVLSAVLTEWVQKLGRVESSAALGVVFTSLFAFGLLLLRTSADSIHIDPDCVLYGTIETVWMDTVQPLSVFGIHPGTAGGWAGAAVPRAAVFNGIALLINVLLVVLFYKELRISAFDPALATAMGINATAVHYALMAVTAATLVAAFESVGSILVIAMLIVPSAAAHLLTDRMSLLIILTLTIAALSALVGHAAALTFPPIIFGRMGFDAVRDASTAGMMAVACGAIFAAAALFAPRQGVLSKLVNRLRLSVRIACEDVLGVLFRWEELQQAKFSRTATGSAPAPGHPDAGSVGMPFSELQAVLGLGEIVSRLALFRLKSGGQIGVERKRWYLTVAGRERAGSLIRSHRLWELYMAKHFDVPDDHLHATAARVEHFLTSEQRADLTAELDSPDHDPHGRVIPQEND